MESARYSTKENILKVVQAIGRRYEWFANQIGWIAGITALIMTLMIMREVIGRYFFNSPSDWTVELSCYLVVALSYLAAAATQLADGYIRVDIFYIRINKKVRNYLDIFISFLSLSWAIALLILGWQFALDSFIKGAHSSQAMMWPLFPSQVLVPIGSLLLALAIVGQIVRKVSAIRKGGD